MKTHKPLQLSICLAGFLLFAVFSNAQDNSIVATGIGVINVSAEGEGKPVAPGEFLSVSINLVNFTGQGSVDVQVNYRIIDANTNEVYSESETVAVETTTSFAKRFQLPKNMAAGIYTFASSLNYPGQETPAVSQLTFVVEKKILGIFRSDFIFYLAALLAIIVASILVTSYIVKINRKGKVVFYDYSEKPKNQRIYYQILSDIISEMRLRIGDDALKIAKDIPDLKINPVNGVVINVEKDPAKIIAQLISRYEQFSGQHISFPIRKNV